MIRKKIIAIRRDDRFSPNSVDQDRLILEAACQKVCLRFEQQGVTCEWQYIDEADLTPHDEADLYLSMARLPETLSVLEGFEQQGRRVVNRPRGVMNCQRSVLDRLMREHHVPMPPDHTPHSTLHTPHPCWLKRGDAAAQSKDDVVFCQDEKALQAAITSFEARGITDYVVSCHIAGDVVKFYGVAPSSLPAAAESGLFRYYYPTDDGQTKYGDEALYNGSAHHYSFDACRLQQEVNRLSQLVGIEVYGGDAIIDPAGRFYIIDFNDWPSFSRCRDAAAEAIADRITR